MSDQPQVIASVEDRPLDELQFERVPLLWREAGIRGSGARGLWARMRVSSRASWTLFTSSNVAQYLSVRHGTSSGSRVIISSEKRRPALRVRMVSTIRLMSSMPSPSGTSDKRYPRSHSSAAMSLRWTLKV